MEGGTDRGNLFSLIIQFEMISITIFKKETLYNNLKVVIQKVLLYRDISSQEFQIPYGEKKG